MVKVTTLAAVLSTTEDVTNRGFAPNSSARIVVNTALGIAPMTITAPCVIQLNPMSTVATMYIGTATIRRPITAINNNRKF